MKIGILTLPLHANYGGILQAYALQKTLENMGHRVDVLSVPVLNRRRNIIYFFRRLIVFVKRCVKKMLIDHNTKINLERHLIDSLPIVCQYTRKFINSYIHERKCFSFAEILESDYDAFIVGSDQVWRPLYFPEIEHAYLDFARDWNVKRIAYAASFGSAIWEYSDEQTKICRSLIQKFNRVSVREKSGVELSYSFLKKNAEIVLDPTMLLSAQDYAIFLNSTEPARVVAYVLDESKHKIQLIEDIERIENVKSLKINSAFEKITAPIEQRIQPPVESWLSHIYGSNLVITDSFHACVFSILFHRDFVVMDNAVRGNSRIQSLLSLFGLEKRMISSIDDYKAKPLIDWNLVDERLSHYRKISINFLEGSLL